MKQWFALTCPVCGFRFPLKKFKPAMKPILYPVQIVTGGGRAKGFKVLKYLPWSMLPKLKQKVVWNSILCLYDRLAAAYDYYYEVLGFLSPQIKTLLQQLQRSYVESYQTNPFAQYPQAYTRARSLQNIFESYDEDDYPEAYTQTLINFLLGDAQNG